MDSIVLIGRLILALAVVLGVMWAIARVAQKRGRGGNRKGQVLTVLARQSVSRNSSIAVVKVMDRALVVGITEGTVTLLGDTDLDAVQELAEPTRPADKRPTDDVDLDARAALEPGAQFAFAPSAVTAPAVARAHRPTRTPRTPRQAQTGRVAAPAGAAPAGALAGSALSFGTWKQAVEAVREKTVRRA